jgi:hypothetical protein
MRRRTLLVVLAGLAVVVAAGVVVLWPRQEPDRKPTSSETSYLDAPTRSGRTFGKGHSTAKLLGPPPVAARAGGGGVGGDGGGC